MLTAWKRKWAFWRKPDEELHMLAQDIEGRARELSVANTAVMGQTADTISLLRHARELLAHIPVASAPVDAMGVADEISVIPANEPVAIAASNPPADSTTALAMSFPNEADEPHPLALEFIKLRDWLLTARSGENARPERTLDGVDRKLRILLEREGFAVVDEKGAFSGDRQEILETMPTADAALHDHVCETVRPGYLFQGRLLRPQQVMIFVHDATLSKQS